MLGVGTVAGTAFLGVELGVVVVVVVLVMGAAEGLVEACPGCVAIMLGHRRVSS
jgi:hypothetical protein